MSEPIQRRPTVTRTAWGGLALAAALLAAGVATAAESPVLWPERQRAFFEDGPMLLFAAEERKRVESASPEKRGEIIDSLLADPNPGTSENELELGIARRQALVRSLLLTPRDARADLFFLHGAPLDRHVVECGEAFRPIEIWRYEDGPGPTTLVLYRPSPTAAYRLWLPLDSKRSLYNEDMAYWLTQAYQYGVQDRARRFIREICSDADRVDRATGTDLLRVTDEGRRRLSNDALAAWLKPPEDLAAWAERAVLTPLSGPDPLPIRSLGIEFPELVQQRMVVRLELVLPAGVEFGADEVDEDGTLRSILAIDGVVEQGGRVFEEFRVRFQRPPEPSDTPIALQLERRLRPERDFLVRLRLRDEVTGAEGWAVRGFRVPATPDEPEAPEEGVEVVSLGEEFLKGRVQGDDSLLLLPPESDVVLSVWRADTLVSGEGITEVEFFVDGEKQLTRTRPPFSAEVRLARFPVEQVVRAVGYNDAGEVVASDEVVLNQPRGLFRVRVAEPRQGASASGPVTVRAEIVVPEEREVERVRFSLGDEEFAVVESPPWAATADIPPGGTTAFLTVTAELDDGTTGEAVRFVNAPEYLDEVEVRLVELLTTVSGRDGRLVRSLGRDAFEVYEDGRRQKLEKFELVEDLPLTIGFAIDTSGSMATALPQAQAAAAGFLDSIMTPRDTAFAIAFSGTPSLVAAPTNDPEAVKLGLGGTRSLGWTALHDAVVTSLYYFRGFRGRKALVLLSDGDDTASHLPFDVAREYARRSGVTIYSVALNVGKLNLSVRDKLSTLAKDTGGRIFSIQKAEDLTSVYAEIEDELRSQYLLAYASDRQEAGEGQFREVEVKVEGGLKAKTIRGYYP